MSRMSEEESLLEEWKANNELFKFHEELKQKRFAQFLTVQAVFIGFFGLIARDAWSDPSIVRLSSLALISVPPLLIAHFLVSMDRRARAYVDTVKAKLLLIELEWRTIDTKRPFSTYKEQFDVLSITNAMSSSRST